MLDDNKNLRLFPFKELSYHFQDASLTNPAMMGPKRHICIALLAGLWFCTLSSLYNWDKFNLLTSMLYARKKEACIVSAYNAANSILTWSISFFLFLCKLSFKDSQVWFGLKSYAVYHFPVSDFSMTPL
jgi:hypothetical protein